MEILLGKINNKEIILPNNAVDCSIELATYLAKKLSLDEYESSLYSNWSLENKLNQFERLLSVLNSKNIDSYVVKFLEIGSGTGLFIVLLKMMGIDAQGIEASVQHYSGSKEIITALLLANNIVEDLIKFTDANSYPFADNYFNVVCSFQVLEHLQDLGEALYEINRVLNKGGIFYSECPNYNYPYEPHYGRPCRTYLGKDTVTHEFKKLGLNTDYLEHLQFITPDSLFKLLKKTGFVNVQVRPVTTIKPYCIHNIVQTSGLLWKYRRSSTPGKYYVIPINALTRLFLQQLGVYPQLSVIAMKN